MFTCNACNEPSVKYDSREKAFKCSICRHTKIVEPRKTRCYRCFTEYVEYTWFDPSGCSVCDVSFVE